MKVSKYVFTFTHVSGSENENAIEALNCSLFSDLLRLHNYLIVCKNQISYYQGRKWDLYKKYTNEYEVVYSPSFEFPGISKYFPASRSYFKLWEILSDFEDELCFATPGSPPLKAAFLAEGPGGFVEAFSKYRHDHGTRGDEYHGISLTSSDKSVPNWKLHHARKLASLSDSQLKIHNGVDGTGNLYELNNVDHFVDQVGAETVHFVTADGGFDFSNNFNDQEERSLHLIVVEIYTALRLQHLGGSFLLKVYDIHTENIVSLLYILFTVYTSIRVLKPLTSRPANSEKYVLCTGFKGVCGSMMSLLRCVCAELRMNETDDSESPAGQYVQDMMRRAIPIPSWFLQEVVYMNSICVARQVYSICDVIRLINDGEKNGEHIVLQSRLHIQIEQSIRWCLKYNIDTNAGAIRANIIHLRNEHKPIVESEWKKGQCKKPNHELWQR